MERKSRSERQRRRGRREAAERRRKRRAEGRRPLCVCVQTRRPLGPGRMAEINVLAPRSPPAAVIERPLGVFGGGGGGDGGCGKRRRARRREIGVSGANKVERALVMARTSEHARSSMARQSCWLACGRLAGHVA